MRCPEGGARFFCARKAAAFSCEMRLRAGSVPALSDTARVLHAAIVFDKTSPETAELARFVINHDMV